MFVGNWDKKDMITAGSEVGGKECVSPRGDTPEIYRSAMNEVYFWGILYNKKELGYAALSNDAEVVARLYEQKGMKGFAGLDGSFTFFLRTPELALIVRDHHGTSYPVYYTKSCFASSLALLQTTEGFSASPDYRMLSLFLSVGYISTPFTALKNVKKLGAGEVLIYKSKQLECRSLFPTDSFGPVTDQSGTSLEEWSERYGILHREAIHRRIGNSRKVGILLSGGYDSGCNLVALRSIYTGDIRSFSIGFKGDNWTELPLARCMSDTFHTLHQEYEIDGSEIAALPEIVSYLGDPFVEGGLMVNYAAMRLIGSDKPDVILGGDGSDQYFGTSGREVALHYLLARSGMKPLAQFGYHLLSRSSFDKNNSFYRIRFHLDKILNILQGDLFGFPDFRLKEMVRDAAYLPFVDKLKPDTRSFEHLYTQHAYKSDVEKIINQVILFKASKMASMFGNTMAFPYMDLELYRFLQQLPVAYKCKGAGAKEIARGHSTAKFLLKYHYKPFLPEVITSKKKQGGFAPMPLFFKDKKQRAGIADYILNASVTQAFLKPKAVESFVTHYETDATQAGHWFWYQQNKAIQYFNLLTLAIWWERFIEGKSTFNLP